MLTPEEARSFLCRAVRVLPAADCSLGKALHGYLAVPVVADGDIPPANRAAMDGYAVRAADTSEAPVRMRVAGEIPAGTPPPGPVEPGCTLRIFTGANLPPGADAVVMVEQTSTRSFHNGVPDTVVTIESPVTPGENIFKQGENARCGALLLPAGTRLGPHQLAVCAATGYARVCIVGRPRLRIIATGSELIDPACPAEPHQVRDSNAALLTAAACAEGFFDVSAVRAGDDPDALSRALRTALAEADAVVLTGGVSAGKYDFVPEVLERAGASIVYRGIAMKPGKPQLLATVTSGSILFGLPGNPLSAVVGWHEFVGPALRIMAGCPTEQAWPAWFLPLAAPAPGRRDRMHVVPSVLKHGEHGACVRPLPPTGSADLVTAARADGAVLVPPGLRELPAGAMAQFRPWRAPA